MTPPNPIKAKLPQGPALGEGSLEIFLSPQEAGLPLGTGPDSGDFVLSQNLSLPWGPGQFQTPLLWQPNSLGPFGLAGPTQPSQAQALLGANFVPKNLGLPERVALYRSLHAALNPKNFEDRLVDFLRQFFNAVHSADLDMRHVPYNNGTGFHRFPEYMPVKDHLAQCPPGKHCSETTIAIPPGTTARVYGEIRPVRGRGESIISRWIIDFDKNVTYKPQNLEIDGFEAVDHPDIEFDWNFSGKKAVRHLPSWGYDYQKVLGEGIPFSTPFGSLVDPPPNGHRDWMIRFQPVQDSLLAGIKEAATDNAPPWSSIDAIRTQAMGSILLWAILPTLGLHGASHFEDLGIRRNSLPRLPGDLFELFRPFFHAEQRCALLHNAPYLNGNNTYIGLYIDERGRRLPIPKDWRQVRDINFQRAAECRELKAKGKEDQCQRPIGRQPIPKNLQVHAAVNRERRKYGLDDIPRSRDSVMNWPFTMFNDHPELLLGLKFLPTASLRLRMRPETLSLPWGGQIGVDGATDILVHYFVRPAYVDVPQNPSNPHGPQKKKLEAHIGVNVNLNPLKLSDLDLAFGTLSLKAKELRAQRAIVHIPSIPGLDGSTPETRPPLTLTLEGVRAEDFELSEPNEDFKLKMKQVRMGRITFTYKAGRWHAILKDVRNRARTKPLAEGEEKGLNVSHPLGGLTVDEFKIPEIRLTQTFRKEEYTELHACTGEEKIKARYKPQFFSMKIPELHSKGDLNLSHEESNTKIQLEGDSSLTDLGAYIQFNDDTTLIQSSLGISGSVDSATFHNPRFGEVGFTTQENGSKDHPIKGQLSATLVRAKKPDQTVPPAQFDLKLDLPYMGFQASEFLEIPEGSSTLTGGVIKLNTKDGKFTGSLEGRLQLQDAAFDGTGRDPIEFLGIKVLPNLKNIIANGGFKFEILEDGYRLRPTSDDPLSLNFDFSGSNVGHRPELTRDYLKRLPESDVIHSQVNMTTAHAEISDVRVFEIRNNKFTKLSGGPVTIQVPHGNARIWAPLGIFGRVRGLFRQFGSRYFGPAPEAPDPAPLTQHMTPEELKEFKERVGEDNYFHLGGIDFSRENGTWNLSMNELMLDFTEKGGRNQFILLRVPELQIDTLRGIPLPQIPQGILGNIYLKEPPRGGSFRIRRWPPTRSPRK